jgi:hypothetical protein
VLTASATVWASRGTVGTTTSSAPAFAATRVTASPKTGAKRRTSPERLPGMTSISGGDARRRSSSAGEGRKRETCSASGWPTNTHRGPSSFCIAAGSNGSSASTRST